VDIDTVNEKINIEHRSNQKVLAWLW